MAKPSQIVSFMLPTDSTLVIDRLIGLDLAQRTAYGQETIIERQKDMLLIDKLFKKRVDGAIGSSDLCEIQQGTAKYALLLEEVVVHLKQVLKVQQSRIGCMTTLKKLGQNMDGEFQSC